MDYLCGVPLQEALMRPCLECCKPPWLSMLRRITLGKDAEQDWNRGFIREKETKEFGISSHAQLKPRELMITLAMVAWTANPTGGEQQLESVLVQNQTMLAVNTFRLKVQRKILMICVGPKQSACPRSQGQSI